MTLRERFNKVMHFQKVDRIPFFEFGYWDATLPEWLQQGLPPEINDEAKAYAYCGIENWAGSPVNTDILPGPVFEPGVIQEDDEYITTREWDGSVTRINKKGIRSIPQHFEYGLKNRDDWQKFKKHLDPNSEGRIDQNFIKNADAINKRDYPLAAPISSMIGVPRNWIGFEHIGVMAYDDPDLLDEIIETRCRVVEVVLEKILPVIKFDFAMGWEDICFNQGPIISPKMFDRFVVPRYKRITDLLRKYGVDIIGTDCDGNLMPILDNFLAGGLNCMFPVEVHGGTDPVRIREKYGRKIVFIGGFDKMALLKGPKEIEKELLRLKPTVDEGGFIPHVDHRVQAGVPFENYKFYLKTKRQLFNCGMLKPQYKE